MFVQAPQFSDFLEIHFDFKTLKKHTFFLDFWLQPVLSLQGQWVQR